MQDVDLALSELDQFTQVKSVDPHINRARALLQAHPEVRALIGPTPSTFLVLLALVAAQIGLALALQQAPLWLIVLVAYTAGAVINCGVLNMVHEASHGLIFRARRWNHWAAYVANLGTLWPSVETFFYYHLPHHRYLGEYDRDPTIARDWEARWVGRSAWRKLLWFVFFPLIYSFRVQHMPVTARVRRRIIFNFLLQATWWVVLYSVAGWRSLAYLALSFYLHFGLHPLNAIALQEHLFINRGQESYSYYGIGNWITLNAGYHVEHHDMPYIAWSRLRRLRALAPEFYDGRHAYYSWTGLILQFIRDQRWSLWARAVRTSEQGIDQSTQVEARQTNRQTKPQTKMQVYRQTENQPEIIDVYLNYDNTQIGVRHSRESGNPC